MDLAHLIDSSPFLCFRKKIGAKRKREEEDSKEEHWCMRSEAEIRSSLAAPSFVSKLLDWCSPIDFYMIIITSFNF